MNTNTVVKFSADLTDSVLRAADRTAAEDSFRETVIAHFGGEKAAAIAAAAMLAETAETEEFDGPACLAWREAERLGEIAAELCEESAHFEVSVR